MKRSGLLRIAAWVPLLFAALPGCGGGGPPVPLFPATGRVLVGGQPAEGVQVRLFDAADPRNPDTHHPYATTDADGRFRLSTFEEGDGAPAGNYSVMLLWPDGPLGPGTPRDRLGNAYTDPSRSPYRATVGEGETELEPFTIDLALVKKAQAKAKAARGRSAPVNPAEVLPPSP